MGFPSQSHFPGSYHLINSVTANHVQKSFNLVGVAGDFKDIVVRCGRHNAGAENPCLGEQGSSLAFRSPDPNEDQFAFDAIIIREIHSFDGIRQFVYLSQNLLGKLGLASNHHRNSGQRRIRAVRNGEALNIVSAGAEEPRYARKNSEAVTSWSSKSALTSG